MNTIPSAFGCYDFCGSKCVSPFLRCPLVALDPKTNPVYQAQGHPYLSGAP
jgi:hypothetical protein